MASRHDTGTVPPGQLSLPDLATDALGWQGFLVSRVALLGTVTSMVVRFDRDAHIARQERGTAQPMLDTDTLAMWEWPQADETFPRSVISVVGVLAHEAQSVKTLVGTARKWRGFSASAVLVPSGRRLSKQQQLECAYSGIAVVAGTGQRVEVLQQGFPGRLANARRTVADRWVEEQLYGTLLSRAESPDAMLPVQLG
ncbi:hypothetical protein ACIA5D_48965 [Actinoplanes sp. NPDC051513]|uniref:hypothetical protein n=1 Tax=Actinoplanes sp. NPDC051513 TaxID=3363908 RepID=UPI00378C7504